MPISVWITESYGIENGSIEWNIYEGNISCHALGKKAFIDTQLSCLLFQLPFILESYGFGYIALSLVIPIIFISIFGKIKQSYRWFILNQGIWDFFIIYSFICDKPTFNGWFKMLYEVTWFKIYKSNADEWLQTTVNQGPPTCFYSSAFAQNPLDNPLKHILQSIFRYAAEDASYAPLLLLTLSRFITLYYKYWCDRYITTSKSVLFIVLFSVFCIVIVNLDDWHYLASMFLVKDDYLNCNATCAGENATACRNNCTIFYYKIINIPHFKIAQYSLPVIILIISNIFAFLLIFKLVKQFKYQAKYNRANLQSSLKITLVVLFQCLTMTFLLTISSCKNYFHIMESLRLYTDQEIEETWPSWIRFLTLEATVHCFNVIRIFLDSLVVLIFLKEYRRSGYRFLRYIVFLIIRPKITIKNLMSKRRSIATVTPCIHRIGSGTKSKLDLITIFA